MNEEKSTKQNQTKLKQKPPKSETQSKQKLIWFELIDLILIQISQSIN